MATSCPNACSRRSASLKERRCALFLGPQSEREGFRYQVAGQTGHDGPLRPLRRSAMSASAHASYSSRLLSVEQNESHERGWCERGILLDEDREFVT